MKWYKKLLPFEQGFVFGYVASIVVWLFVELLATFNKIIINHFLSH